MKNNITELVFILDRSGSMSGLEDDTIGGFNSLLEKQKREPGRAGPMCPPSCSTTRPPSCTTAWTFRRYGP